MIKIKIPNIILAVVFIIILPLMLILTDLLFNTFNKAFYRQEYQKYGIAEDIGVSAQELETSTDKLLLYIDNKRQDLNFTAEIKGQKEEFFSERDKLHMVDVKNLFTLAKFVRLITFILCVSYVFYMYKIVQGGKHKLAKYSLISAIIGMLPIILVIMLMFTDFNKYFDKFHEIFFNNDLWLLDPRNDRLINMFPLDFFFDIASRIFTYYIMQLLGIAAISIIYIKKVPEVALSHAKKN